MVNFNRKIYTSGSTGQKLFPPRMVVKQLIFAAAWGVIEEAGGPYPLSKMPELIRKFKSLGCEFRCA